MQGLADGYFVLPYTIADYLADDIKTGAISTALPEFDEAEKSVRDFSERLMNIKGTKPVDYFHKRLGKAMWNYVGMGRTEEGLKKAITEIQQIRQDFYNDVKIPGTIEELNPELDKALRLSDFLELGELMAMDALNRSESCGGHFREESQTEKGEALRDDDRFAYVAAWEYKGEPSQAVLHKEELKFEVVKLAQRNYE